MKNRLIQFLPVLLIAFVSFATLGIVQAQNRNPCADTPEAERLLSELTTACSEQSSEKIEKFIEKWEQESRTATIYDTNDKLTTTVYQLLDYLMEKYYFNNKQLNYQPELAFSVTKNISIVSVLKTYRRIDGFPKWIIHRNESSKGTVPAMRLNKFGS